MSGTIFQADAGVCPHSPKGEEAYRQTVV